MSKVFLNEEWENLSLSGQVIHYGYYHKYRLPDGSVNPEFRTDAISGLILDVKEKKEKGLNFFFTALQYEIEKGISICVVPSHVAGTHNDSGISELARRLASDGRIDKTDCLLRTKSIHKLAGGGDRDIRTQRESLAINPDISISGDVVLLVDDVTTSGNSLTVCKELLEKNGATRVAMFALGKSI